MNFAKFLVILFVFQVMFIIYNNVQASYSTVASTDADMTNLTGMALTGDLYVGDDVNVVDSINVGGDITITGDLVLASDAYGSFDLKPETSAMTFKAYTNYSQEIVSFVNTAPETQFLRFRVPADYAASGDMKLEVYQVPAASATGNVVWSGKAIGIADNETSDAAGTSFSNETQVIITGTKQYITEIDLNTSALVAGDNVAVMLYRNTEKALDTVAQVIDVLGFRVKYQRGY